MATREPLSQIAPNRPATVLQHKQNRSETADVSLNVQRDNSPGEAEQVALVQGHGAVRVLDRIKTQMEICCY